MMSLVRPSVQPWFDHKTGNHYLFSCLTGLVFKTMVLLSFNTPRHHTSPMDHRRCLATVSQIISLSNMCLSLSDMWKLGLLLMKPTT